MGRVINRLRGVKRDSRNLSSGVVFGAVLMYTGNYCVVHFSMVRIIYCRIDNAGPREEEIAGENYSK